MIINAEVDEQGRPDLLNSRSARELAEKILQVKPNAGELAYLLIEIEQHGLAIGRNEIGPGSPYRHTGESL